MELDNLINDWDNIILEFDCDSERWYIKREYIKELFIDNLKEETNIVFMEDEFRVNHRNKCDSLSIVINSDANAEYGGNIPAFKEKTSFYRIHNYHDLEAVSFVVKGKEVLRVYLPYHQSPEAPEENDCLCR